MGNSNIIHRILVNAAVDTKLCVKSSADKDDFNDAEKKVKLMLYLCLVKTIDLWQFISNQYQH